MKGRRSLSPGRCPITPGNASSTLRPSYVRQPPEAGKSASAGREALRPLCDASFSRPSASVSTPRAPQLLPTRSLPSPTSAMPALLVDTSTPSTSPSVASTPSDQRTQHRSQSRSPSPDRPPVSPITPTVQPAQLARPANSDARPRVAPPQAPPPTATFRQQPPSVPISESENPDAIALRSAISLLQLQREKSKRDLKALEDLKQQAIQDPHAFVRSLQDQHRDQQSTPAGILTPTLSDIAEQAAKESADGHSGEAMGGARKDSAHVDGPDKDAPRFPAIPQPQNVVRCPPVNWAKYHVVGESLDKMHEEQKRYPGASEPPRAQNGTRAPPHRVAAPYSPFTDGVGGPPSASHPVRAPKKSPP